MICAILTVPAEIVSLVGGALLAVAGWQLKVTLDLAKQIAVLKRDVDDLRFRIGRLEPNPVAR